MAPTTRSTSQAHVAQNAASPSKNNRQQRRKNRQESFSIYNYQVLKRQHPDLGISRAGMEVMNNLMQDVFDRLATTAGKLVKVNQSKTMGVPELTCAVRLMLPRGTLLQHTENEAQKALQNFKSNSN